MAEILDAPMIPVQLMVEKTNDDTAVWQYKTSSGDWKLFGDGQRFDACTSANSIDVQITASPDIDAWLSLGTRRPGTSTWVVPVPAVGQIACICSEGFVQENGKVADVGDPTFYIKRTQTKPAEKKPLQKP